MDPAFWDSSALVPLCVRRQAGARLRRLVSQYDMVVWWATPVEMQSAFARLHRMGQLTAAEQAAASAALLQLRRSWREMQPIEPIRSEAETLLSRFPLRAADTLQLAAALIWAAGNPQGRIFISGDEQLLQAAQQLGFQTIEP